MIWFKNVTPKSINNEECPKSSTTILGSASHDDEQQLFNFNPELIARFENN
jgi:hypothetical protein